MILGKDKCILSDAVYLSPALHAIVVHLWWEAHLKLCLVRPLALIGCVDGEQQWVVVADCQLSSIAMRGKQE